MIKVYHNPRCGKSRNCLAFLEETATEYEIIKYLEQTPSYEELEDLLKKLDLNPIELVRQKEKIWIENYKNKTMSDQEIINAMVTNPILVERPILIKDDKAIIARDPEKLKSFIQ